MSLEWLWLFNAFLGFHVVLFYFIIYFKVIRQFYECIYNINLNICFTFIFKMKNFIILINIKLILFFVNENK